MQKLQQEDRGDYVLSFTAIFQYFLTILQICMIYLLGMVPESTTIYRVVLSAIPVIIAFYYLLRRIPLLTIGTYLFALIVVVFHYMVFERNSEFILKSTTRFLLPVCIPCFLSLVAVRKFENLKKVLEIVSWATIGLLILYMAGFFKGLFLIEEYNMSFSYGLLLPTLILYNQKKIFPILVSVIAFIAILAIGSRGAAIVIALYVIYDVFANHRKYIPMLLAAIVILGSGLLSLFNYLDAVGIRSRTISMMLGGQTISYLSGRDNLYNIIWNSIMDNPIFGLGLFSDRTLLRGSYCHNIFLEMMMDFGIPITVFLSILFLYQTAHTYLHIHNEQRSVLTIFFMSAIVPLMVSGTYLESEIFFSFIGLLVFFNKNKIIPDYEENLSPYGCASKR